MMVLMNEFSFAKSSYDLHSWLTHSMCNYHLLWPPVAPYGAPAGKGCWEALRLQAGLSLPMAGGSSVLPFFVCLLSWKRYNICMEIPWSSS